VRDGWEVRALADVCDVFADGDWVESKDQSPVGIRLVQTGNIGGGLFKDRAEKARYVSEDTFTRLRCTEIFAGDCLISRLPDPVGRSCLLPETGSRTITAVDCTIARFNPRWLLPEFFNYVSQSDDYLKAVDAETTGTTRKRISRNRLGKVKIPVPPLAEQKRIVGILDEAFASIATAKANADKNLQNARALFESRLQSVFVQRAGGWNDYRRLADLTDSDSPITYGVVKPGDEGDVVFVRGGDLARGRILVGQLRTITRVVSDQYRRTLLRGGEVLVSLVGQPGQVAVVPSELAGANIARQVGLLRLSPRMNAEFVRLFLQSPVGQSALGARQSGSVQQVINLGELRQVLVPTPPQEVQAAVVRDLRLFAERAQRLESNCSRKLAALEELKKSLLHRAFAGQLGTATA
jgi:type I restriction enzyme S subunit